MNIFIKSYYHLLSLQINYISGKKEVAEIKKERVEL